MDLTTVSLSLIRFLGVRECTACLGDCHLSYYIPSHVGWVSLFTAGASMQLSCGPRRLLPEEHKAFVAIRAHRIFI